MRCALEAADEGWPEPLRGTVPVNVTVPAVGPEQAAAIVRAGNGCTTAKVKVAEPGQTRAEEEVRLEAVRDARGPAGRIRVDANGGWSVDEAVEAVRTLHRAAGGLEYVEQPCASVEDLARVRRRVDVPGSKRAFDVQGKQVRYLTIQPKRDAVIKQIDFVKGTDETAPVVVAVTIEGKE